MIDVMITTTNDHTAEVPDSIMAGDLTDSIVVPKVPMQTFTEFVLTLRPQPDASDPQGVRWLRWALKTLLRRFGLRCVRCGP